MSVAQKITLQQIIDAAWQRFIVEDAPPSVSGGLCAYRTRDGRACAVGLCLPEDHEAARMQADFFKVVLRFPGLFDESVLLASEDGLNNFQRRLHDDLQSDGEWKSQPHIRACVYREVARDYGLTLPNGGVL